MPVTGSEVGRRIRMRPQLLSRLPAFRLSDGLEQAEEGFHLSPVVQQTHILSRGLQYRFHRTFPFLPCCRHTAPLSFCNACREVKTSTSIMADFAENCLLYPVLFLPVQLLPVESLPAIPLS